MIQERKGLKILKLQGDETFMDITFQQFIFAFSLTVFAGLATGIGSLLSLLTNRTNTKFLSVALGFSAGVMIYVSMIEIYRKANDSLAMVLGEKMGAAVTVISFLAVCCSLP
jgi:ZIP family zinc transporter